MIESDYFSDDNELLQKLGRIPTLRNLQMEQLS